ncbi:recombinase family protein [Nocardia cyriacigeorgica]|uniref:recombinase family protein n=1 Tax=Nocardia cyriacigeorgica TaxID=135487 RepID=UPI0018938CAF|nr:recombinase family protein [Nocardia cyriacigeorgica]MBF6399204.1 recombinase family protein [Nocardia cyriacigeorgica]MBF6404835.1 recombinase family protein [Nocardia cyriacigeorgica]
MAKPQFTAGNGLMLDIYARVSRVGDERQRSTGGQVDDCTVRVHDLGATVGQVHVDDGRSAWNPSVKRPKWDALMARLESGETGGVVVFDMARFSRRPIEGERLILAAERGLVVLDSEGEYDLETANGRKTFRDQLNAAAYESDRLSSRVKRGKRVKVARGESNHAHRPYGYEKDGITVRESEAAIVREIVARVLDKHAAIQAKTEAAGEDTAAEVKEDAVGYKTIAVDLNRRGITTRTGSAWSGEKVKRLVLNPRYAGFVTHHGQIVAAMTGANPLITPEQWERLCLLRDTTRVGRPATADYLCSGLVHCGLCGRGLTGRPQHGRTYPDGQVRRRYLCQKRQTGGGCNRISVDARTLDREVGALVVATLSDPRHADALIAAANDLAKHRRPIADALAEARETATVMSARLGNGEIILDRYDTVMAGVDARIVKLEAELAALDTEYDVDDSPAVRAESAQAWEAQWADAGTADKRAMIKRALRGSRLVVGPATHAGPKFDPSRIRLVDKNTPHPGAQDSPGARVTGDAGTGGRGRGFVA